MYNRLGIRMDLGFLKIILEIRIKGVMFLIFWVEMIFSLELFININYWLSVKIW